MSTSEILESARKLRPHEQLELVDALLAALDEPSPAVEAAWVREAEDRVRALERGELQALPMEELLSRHRTE